MTGRAAALDVELEDLALIGTLTERRAFDGEGWEQRAVERGHRYPSSSLRHPDRLTLMTSSDVAPTHKLRRAARVYLVFAIIWWTVFVFGLGGLIVAALGAFSWRTTVDSANIIAFVVWAIFFVTVPLLFAIHSTRRRIARRTELKRLQLGAGSGEKSHA